MNQIKRNRPSGSISFKVSHNMCFICNIYLFILYNFSFSIINKNIFLLKHIRGNYTPFSYIN